MLFMKKKKIFVPLLFLLCIVSTQLYASVISLSGLRQVIADSRDNPLPSKLVYTEEVQDLNPDENSMADLANMYNDSNFLTIGNVDQYKQNKVSCVIDPLNNRYKTVINDLRDVEQILKVNDMPDKYAVTISQSIVRVRDNDISMSLKSSETDTVALSKPLYSTDYMMKKMSIGVISEILLSEKKNPQLENIEIDGKNLLKIKNKSDTDGSSVEIICDPQIGYKFKSIRYYAKDKLFKEVIADDYRDVSGTPYPFLYEVKEFDQTGSIKKSHKMVFEDVQFGIEVSDEDFKIDVPEGANVLDMVFTKKVEEFGEKGKFSIDDVMHIQAERLAEGVIDELPEALNNLPKPKTVKGKANNKKCIAQNVIFIPNQNFAKKAEKPFIFDITNGTLLSFDQTHSNFTKLEKGDIAWDGSLLALRNSKVLSISKEYPLEFEKEEFLGRYSLPKDAKLPYSVVITTKENRNYLMNIVKIEDNGITINYEKITSDQAKQYQK